MNNKVAKTTPSAWKKVKKSGTYYKRIRKEYEKMMMLSPLQMAQINQIPITSIFPLTSRQIDQSATAPLIQSNASLSAQQINQPAASASSAQHTIQSDVHADISDEHNYSMETPSDSTSGVYHICQ